jgi:hypothetical protein
MSVLFPKYLHNHISQYASPRYPASGEAERPCLRSSIISTSGLSFSMVREEHKEQDALQAPRFRQGLEAGAAYQVVSTRAVCRRASRV